jgi:hypothetical protein
VPRCPRLRRRRRRAAPRCTHQGCRAARAAGTPRSGCCRSTSQGAKCERLSTTLRGGRLEASARRHTSLELAERVASPMQRTAHATRLGFSSALCVVPSDSLSAPPSMCYSNALGSTVTVPSCPRAYPAAGRALQFSQRSHEMLAQFRMRLRTSHTRTIRSTPVRGLRKGSPFFVPI